MMGQFLESPMAVIRRGRSSPITERICSEFARGF